MKQIQTDNIDNYSTANIKDVYAMEEVYLNERRKVNKITENEAKETWGLCISSGGVRSSILSLGFIQALIKLNFFRRFDYLSTVGGGGFIGGCLTSLLTGSKSATGKFGVSPKNSPFNQGSELPVINSGMPTAEQQLEHLKKSRGYIPDFSPTKLSFNNFLGVWLGGWLYVMFVFFLALMLTASGTIAFLDWVSDSGSFNAFIKDYYLGMRETNLLGRFGIVYDSISTACVHIFHSFDSIGFYLLLGLSCSGLVFTLGYMESQRMYLLPNSHKSIIDKKAKRYILLMIACMVSIIFTVGVIRGIDALEFLPKFKYWLVFLFPFAISFGAWIGTHVISIIYYRLSLERPNIEEVRQMISNIKGSALLILLSSAICPFIFMISLYIGGWLVLIMALALFVAGTYLVFYKSEKLLIPHFKNHFSFRWISNIAVSLIIFFSFSGIIRVLIYLQDKQNLTIYVVFMISLIIAVLLFFFSQGNRSNLHNYLKSKLAEAILVTESRQESGDLKNLRNDTALKLHEIGEDNFSGPYHIINASVNVHQSSEEYRRLRMALPFVFTKYFVGSEATKYVRSNIYQEGKTRLVDAITNSTARIHSGMGIYSIWPQSFVITSLNLRFGGWIHNPLYYQKGIRRSRLNHSFRNLIKEFIGRFDERSRYINVSDGTHCGDNYGLVSLIQRECSHIVLCDFTSKKHQSLIINPYQQTLNLIKQYNVQSVDIDMEAFKAPGDKKLCSSCVQVGTIQYKSGKTAQLYYVKALISEDMPTDLKEYSRSELDFPFESLTKQSFETGKFEMYRTLGSHLGQVFLKKQAFNKKENDRNELYGLIDRRILQLEEELGISSSESLLKTMTAQERLVYFEQLIGKAEQLLSIADVKTSQEVKGLIDAKKLLQEKLNYLRLAKAKLAEGSEKFEITKDMQAVEKELAEIEEQLKKLNIQ